MKNLFMVLVLTMPPTVSVAQSNNAQAFCTESGELAEAIMGARQTNVPLSQSMEIAQAVEEPDMRRFVTMIVLEAYNKPHFSTQEYVDRAVRDFRNMVELACYQGMNAD